MSKTALITGASSGLGAEFARQLAARGVDLVLVALDKPALRALAEEIRGAHGVECEVLTADLLKPRPLAKVIARLTDSARPIDLLVNSAGFGVPLTFASNDIAEEDRHLDIHVAVPMRITHAALGAMLARGSGRIVNVASVAGFTPSSTYGAVKSWLISFSRWANATYAPRGVSVTAVCPGFTRTNFHEPLGIVPGRGLAEWMWLDSRDVVREALRDIARGKSVSVPSLRYKALVALSRLTPDRLAVALASQRGL